MIRLYARLMIALGLAGVLFAGAKLAVIPSEPTAYYACPEGGDAHRQGCPWVDWTRTDLLRLAGPRAAERRGLCEACCPRAVSQRGPSSTRSRLPIPEGTARAQIQPAAD